MDPITTAILAALPTLASDLLKSSVKDAYEGLKSVIRRKFGEASPVAGALADLEANPNSKGQAIVLSEQVVEAKATNDQEVMQSLATLVEELKKRGIGGKSVADMTINISGGSQGVVGAGNISIGSMSVGVPPRRGNS